MFLALPSFFVIAVYLLAAVLPALFLMRYIYRHDTVEREPPALLFSLALWGIAAALASILLERLGFHLLSLYPRITGPAHALITAFLVVAVVEEGTKFIVLKLRTWRDPNFNYRFDGVVYAVFVSLGFAAFENIRYILGYGLTIAFTRAVLAIPGHMGFAVFMGVFYGRAKRWEREGNKTKKNANLLLGYLMAVFLHGFYDACVMIGTVWSTLLFYAFVAVMYVVVIRMIKKESAADKPV